MNIKNAWWNHLRIRLICLVLISALPLLFAIIYDTIKFQQHTEKQLQNNAIKSAILAGNIQKQLIEGTRQFLIGLSHNPELIGNNYDYCNHFLSHMLKEYPAYLNIGVCNLKGDILCSAIPLASPVNVSHRLYFQRTLQNRDFSMGSYQIGIITKKQSVNFGFPILKTDNSLHKVVFAALSLDWLDSILQKLPLPDGAFVVVSDLEGQILGSYPNAVQWTGKIIPKKILISNTNDLPKLMNAKWIDNTNILYVAKPLDYNGIISAHLIIGIPKHVLFAETNKILKQNIVIFVIVTLAALFTAGIIAEIFFILPINSLLSATKILTKGDYSIRTGFSPEDKSEFGQLGRAFDEMAASIEQHAQNIETTKHELQTALKEHEAVNEHLRIAILEQAKTKEALQKNEEQFRQAQKMEAIGRLAGGIAHDFNNILTVIIGHTELLQNSINTKDLLKESLNEIYNASQRATILVRQLLAFSRKQVLEAKIVSLNEIVNGIKSMLKRTIGETITLNISLASNISSVKADPGQIEQVILNLVVNARDAMPDGGYLTIETANITLEKEYTANRFDVQPGEYAMLAISDTGYGMSKETLSHMFEPFFTTKEKGKGTGLGLSTVYGIVKQSSGHIFVYSEPNHGTTFKIYLPQVNELPEAAKNSQKSTSFTRRQETILVVEDEEGVRSLIREILHRHGYTVLQASNGEEAIKLATSYEKEIHLLITDVIIPGLSGRETAARILDLRPKIRVLYISGYTDNAIVHQGILEPGISFMQKPFTTTTLTNKIREILDSQAIS